MVPPNIDIGVQDDLYARDLKLPGQINAQTAQILMGSLDGLSKAQYYYCIDWRFCRAFF